MANSALKTLSFSPTTNTDIVQIYPKQGYKSITIVFRNTGANSATVQVDGGASKDLYPVAVQASAAVVGGASLVVNYNTNYLPFLRIAVRSTTVSQVSTVKADIATYEY